MKWTIKPVLKWGDVRVVHRFAWFPMRVGETTRVWLARYWSVEKYEPSCMDDSAWHVLERSLVRPSVDRRRE